MMACHDAANTLTYDAEGRLATSYSPIFGVTSSYFYDAGGQRVSKIFGSYETDYVHDPGGALLATYVNGSYFGNFQDMWVNGMHFGEVVMAAGNASQTQNFSLTDWLGSQAAYTDPATGVPNAAYVSQPFGDAQTTLFGSSNDDIHFTGKERDGETGNDYFGARYYASSMGRMLSPDSGVDQHPENPQSWNLYAYVQNNPLIATDPSGEFTCDFKTVSAQQCENAHISDEEAGAALDGIKKKYGEDSNQYKDAVRAHEALGGRKDNGVVLTIGKAGKDSEGNVTIGPSQAKTEDNPNGQNIRVTLGAAEFDGSEAAATSIEHEGSHVADAHDWINAGFNPSASVNFFGSEFRAYSVEANLAEALGIQIAFHGGEEIFGLGSLAATSETAKGVEIRMILRQSPYHLNPNSKLTLWQRNTRGGH